MPQKNTHAGHDRRRDANPGLTPGGRHRAGRWPLILPLTLVLLGPCAARAAETTDELDRVILAPQGSEASAQEPAPRIEEIIVTTTRHERAARSLPMSIDVFSGAELHDAGASGLEQILHRSPGVTFRKGENGDTNNLTIRGIGGNTFFFNRAFGMYFGDVSLINPTFIGPQPDIDPFDMQTVEILKGPQGTIFGGTALAGAVRYLPNPPDFGDAQGHVSGGLGMSSQSEELNQNLALMWNRTAGDHWALRFAGTLRRAGGYIDDLRNERADINTSFAGQARLLATRRTSAGSELRLVYLQRRFETDDSSLTDNLSRLETRHKFFPEWAHSQLEIRGAEFETAHLDSMSLRLSSHQLLKSGGLLRDLTTVGDFQQTPNRTPQPFDFDVEGWTHEIRLVSSQRTQHHNWLLADWDYVAGIVAMRTDQYMLIDVGLAQADSEPVPDSAPTSDRDQGNAAALIEGRALASEYAGYFDFTRSLFGERFELGLGGRLFEQRTNGVIVSEAVIRPGDPAPILAGPLDESRGALRERGFNPRVSLTAHLNTALSLFVSTAKGFRFGGFNADPFLGRKTIGDPPLEFRSDQLWNHELGLRSNWLGGRLQFDATLFMLIWQNMQTNQVAETKPFTTPFIDNIGGSRSDGAELALRARSPFGLTMRLGAAYTNARTSAAFDAPGGHVDKGTALPNAPRLAFAAGLELAVDRHAYHFNGHLSYAWQDDSRSDFFNRVPLAAYDLLDFGLRLTLPQRQGHPELRLTVTNLLDRRAVLTAIGDGDAADGGNEQIFTNLLSPRRALLNLGFSFS